MQHYEIKFVSGLLWVTPVSSSNKTDGHNITEILLKVALDAITLTPFDITVSCVCQIYLYFVAQQES